MIRSVVEELLTLMRYARRLIPSALRPRFGPRDLIQECYVQAQERRDELEQMDCTTLREWVRRHLRQIAHDRWRSWKGEEERLHLVARSVEVVVSEDYEPPLAWFGAFLRSLGHNGALLFVLVRVKHRQVKEVARKLGVSPETAYQRLRRFKRRLEQQWRPHV